MKIERRWVAVVAAIILIVMGLLLEGDGREQTDSTFGVAANGYKALHDLFVELGMRVRRSYLSPQDLPPDATVWWLGASQSRFEFNGGPCRRVDDDAEADEVWSGKAWLEAGGTAVVFAAGDRPDQSCSGVAGFDLPPTSQVDADGKLVKPRKRSRGRRPSGDPPRFEVRGPELDRELRSYEAVVFEDSGDWTAVAWLEEYPLILERAVGQGTLVVVADSALLQNRWLATGDAAPFAVDLVQRYGVPRFDENAHGFRPSQAVVAYLAASPARSVFGGLCLLGLLIVWRGSFVPGKAPVVSEPPAPALDAYVNSLAGWYARTSDYARVAERYRQYAFTRLRRHLGLSAEITPEAVLDRLRSTPRSAGLNRASLLRSPTPRSRDELLAVAGEIDAAIHAALQSGAAGGTTRPNPARD